jgi:hypothetical protein
MVNRSRIFWAALGGVMTLAAALLWLAPAEATLGQGIKAVYLHVALTWAGMTGLGVAALVALAAVTSRRPSWRPWVLTIAWVALAFHGGGTLMSLVAADINWGAMFWSEPRTRVALSLLALGLIVQVINSWMGEEEADRRTATLTLSQRLALLLYPALVAYMVISTATTPLVLHPRDPIRSSTSVAIQLTFAGLFLLALLAAALLAWRARRKLAP